MMHVLITIGYLTSYLLLGHILISDYMHRKWNCHFSTDVLNRMTELKTELHCIHITF